MSDVPSSIIFAPPLTIWYGKVFEIWFRRWPLWLGLGMLSNVLSWLIDHAILYGFGVNPTEWANREYPLWLIESVVFSSVALNLFFDAIFLPAYVLLALRLHRREPLYPSFATTTIRFFWRALGTEVLTMLIITAGVLACCIGVFVAYPLTFIAIPAVIAEGAGARRTITRSWELTSPQLGRILLFAIPFLAISFILPHISDRLGSTTLLGQTLSVTIGAITGPIIVISQTVAYIFSTEQTVHTEDRITGN